MVASKVGKKKKNQILVLLIQEYSTWTRSYRELLSKLPSVPATWKAVLAQRSLPVRIDLASNLMMIGLVRFDCMCEACRADLPSLDRIPDDLK